MLHYDVNMLGKHNYIPFHYGNVIMLHFTKVIMILCMSVGKLLS